MNKPASPKENKTAVITIRTTEDIKQKAEAAADAEDSSLSRWVTLLIKAALKNKRRG